MKWLASVATRLPEWYLKKRGQSRKARRPAMDHLAIDVGGRESRRVFGGATEQLCRRGDV
jgi:hypothetical protein